MVAITRPVEGPTKTERRRAPRNRPALRTVFRAAGSGGKPWLGLVWNVSPWGVGMLVSDPVGPGAVVSGELATTDAAARLPVGFRAAHVKRLQTGDYFVGGPFDRPLTADELRPFLGPA